MADPVEKSGPTHPPADTGGPAILLGRVSKLWALVAIVTLVILMVGIYFARLHFHNSGLAGRLTGTWTSNHVREDKTVDTFIWKFLADGTMRHHLEGQPSPETGSVDDYMWWHVSDGLLVLTYDPEFPHGASIKWKLQRAVGYVREFATGSNLPLDRQDRCIVSDSGMDWIELSLHPSESAHDSWFGDGIFVLTRIPDGITK